MTFDIRPLLSFRFWFDMTPEPFLRSTEVLLLIVFSCSILAAIFFQTFSRRKRSDPPFHRLFRGLGRLCTVTGILGWILFWVSYEHLPFLSMRFWYALWFFMNIGVGVWIVIRFFRTASHERNAMRERKLREQYLP